MKKLLKYGLLFLLLASSGKLMAQQEALYSQYIFNGLVINPAYAGSRDQMSITALARRQWVGMARAPRTETFSVHAPLPDKRHGFGLTLISDRIGWQNDIDLNFNYAFRLPLTDSLHLALGILGGVKYHRVSLSEIDVVDGGDPAFSDGDLVRLLPSAGAGLYLDHPRYFAGISTPNFLRNRMARTLPDGSLEGISSNHYFFTAGALIPVAFEIDLRPSLMLRSVRGAPLSLDLNLLAGYQQKYWAGFSWRPGDAFVVMAEARLTRQIRVGYAYDFTLSGLNQYGAGSHELRLGLDFGFLKNQVESPRNFYF